MGNYAGTCWSASVCPPVELDDREYVAPSICCKGVVCPMAEMGNGEVMDDGGDFSPAGTVFEDTLQDLPEVDRLLLTFCSSATFAAVRWLLTLGANVDACDCNGTTCLHIACRTGSLTIVRELIKRRASLNATDVAGWTPLHVACSMGQRRIGLCLMQSGADIVAHNVKGLMPVDLCCDFWLRAAINSCIVHRRIHGPAVPWKYACDSEIDEDIRVKTCLQFEPVFVPRKPVLKDSNCTAMLELGVDIFNQQPGQGLAFLVATGTIKDFPVELSTFMLENNVDPVQVGEFLGDNCSLSHSLRLEYINLTTLWRTGVVGCLTKIFTKFQMPSDLQKINRLVQSIAQIWWRQHEKKRIVVPQPQHEEEIDSEMDGLRLKYQLASHGALHQLMLSTLLLHYNLHAPLPPSQRISLWQWQEMTAEPEESKSSPRGSTCSRAAGMTLVCSLIYHRIKSNFFPQLQFWSGQDGSLDVRGAPDTAANNLFRENLPERPIFRNSIGGWATLIGGSCPMPPGSARTVTYQHIRSILSETSSTTISSSSSTTCRSSCPSEAAFSEHDAPASGGDRRPEQVHWHGLVAVPPQRTGRKSLRQATGAGGPAALHGCDHERVWLSLRCGLLLVATKPNGWAPHAFVHLSDAVRMHVDEESVTLTLAMDEPDQRRARSDGRGAPVKQFPQGSQGQLAEGPRLQLVFLLPDGLWRAIGIPHMQIQLGDLQELWLWRQRVEEHALLVDPGGRSCTCESRPARREAI